jgi:uncharacterized membrane protein
MEDGVSRMVVAAQQALPLLWTVAAGILHRARHTRSSRHCFILRISGYCLPYR